MNPYTMNHQSPPPIWRRALVLGGTAVLAGLLVTWAIAKETAKAPPVHFDVSSAPISNEAKSMYPSYSPVVKKVAPSVVKVSITAQAQLGERSEGSESSEGQLDIPGLGDLRRFFGEEQNQNGRGPNMHRQSRAPKEHGVGSGVIVTKDGYILTNNHVVDHATEIKVSLNDGRDFTAKVIGRDPHTDIAVVKIDAHDLPALTLGDSDNIDVGDRVLAVGNPFGIGQTVTTGIVSAKGRASLGLDYEDFIQTDAPINPGNSGGALVDVDGRLIGINTAILSHSGGNQGIGFAVPSNLARWVMTSLVNTGTVSRGFLGVNIQDMNAELAKEFKLSDDHGALVSEVTPDSPAAKAGIKSGDVIVKFNDKAVTDSRHLKLAVGETTPGSTVPVEILRDGASQTLSVTLKQLPGDKMAKNTPAAEKTGDALHGVAVGDLDDSLRTQLKLPAHLHGVVINQVDPDSASYEAGLREGDVITEINRKPVENAQQAVAACETPTGKQTLVKVWSHGGSHFIVVDETQAG